MSPDKNDLTLEKMKIDSRLQALETKFDKMDITLTEIKHSIVGTVATIGLMEDLRNAKKTINTIEKTIEDIDKIDVRVMELENDKAKIMGGKTAIFTAAAVVAFLTTVLTKWWTK